VPSDHRTEEEIRREITAEREQLADALADLREGIDAKRKPVTVISSVLAAALAAAMAIKVVRRLKGVWSR
jgi:hypothetical protein